jgi:hypothetical protein
MGMAVADAAVGVALGPAPISEPRTPEGVPEDVVESEGEPEVALEPVPEVVQEGAMIVVRVAAAPPPSHAMPPAREWRWSWGIPPLTRRATGDFSMGEAQAQHVLHHEGEDLVDERRHLQLWASLLKRMTMSERAAAWARQHGFDL